MLTANNSANSKAWQYDTSITDTLTPTAEDFHIQQGSVGLIIEARSKGMYDSLKDGGGALTVIEVGPWNEETQRAKFISNFGFE